MSTSTVSVTANPTSTAAARRRAVVIGEKKTDLDVAGTDASPATGEAATVLERSRDHMVQVKKALPTNSTTTLPRRHTTRKSASKEKPRWKTVVSVFTKNFILLLVMLLLVQMIRWLAVNQGRNGAGSAVPSSADYYDGRIAEMEAFLKTTTKMMQGQLEVVDRKMENEILGLKNELGKRIEDNGAEFASQLHKLDGRVESLEKSLGATEWLSKDDFDKFLEEFKKAKGLGEGDGDVNLDEVRAFAREIVKKEIEKHAADGLGMVDYALESGGGMVVKHSEPYMASKVGNWFINRNGVHVDAWKMLRPSFGEPGHCFPLKGGSGFVQIMLRTAIIPEAVTLEHVAKSVAYDRSSAPKDCRVSGWFRGHNNPDLVVDNEKMLLLTEFTYDLEKSNAQTFNVLDSAGAGVDMIRLDFTSNHGSASHTCIYRLRVHGREPNSVAVQS